MTNQKKTYEKIWDTTLIDDGNVPFQKKQPDEEVVAFLDTCRKKGTVLDMGCGAGRHCKIFADKGHSVTGFDFSKNAIELAKKWVFNVDFHVASVFDFKDDKKYDYIIDYGCLHHIKKSDWNAYRKTVLRHSHPGTKMFLFAFSDKSLYMMDHKLTNYERKMRYTLYEGDYSHFFSLQEIKILFKEFKIIYHSIKKKLERTQVFIHFILNDYNFKLTTLLTPDC